MADNTKASKAKADEAKDEKPAEVKTSEPVASGTVTTTEKAEATEVPSTPQEQEPEDEFAYDDYTDEVDGALGTVSEGGYDVPWKYVTADDFAENGALSDYAETVRTADSDDEDVVKWTVQDAFETEDDDETVNLVPVQATPGQTFTPEELPNPENLKAAGINVQQYLSGLPVRPAYEDEPVRRGIPA